MRSLRSYAGLLALAALPGGCAAYSPWAAATSPPPPALDPASNAQVIVAASASQADVQTAVLEAANGDTVLVPPGTAVWETPVYTTEGITLEGSGIGRTVIENPHVDFFDALIVVTSQNPEPFRITGFTFRGMHDGSFTDNSDCILIEESVPQFRIDHNEFTLGGSHSIWIDGAAYGVIDHNQFIDPSQEVISIFGGATGNTSWSEPLDMGGPDAVYAENNVFEFITKGDHAITGVNGARYVFRYNRVTSTALLNANQVDVHDNYFDARGTRKFEIYDNTLQSGGSYMGMYIRGGTGVIFDNTFAGTYTEPIIFTDYRAWETTYEGNPVSTSCGYVDCTYPTIDQISDTYVWGNTYQGKTVAPYIDTRGLVSEMVQLGRDYFLSSMPGYTPYPYPYPLTVSGPLAAPPISLSAVGR